MVNVMQFPTGPLSEFEVSRLAQSSCVTSTSSLKISFVESNKCNKLIRSDLSFLSDLSGQDDKQVSLDIWHD